MQCSWLLHTAYIMSVNYINTYAYLCLTPANISYNFMFVVDGIYVQGKLHSDVGRMLESLHLVVKDTFSLYLCHFPMFEGFPTGYVVILPYNFITRNRLLTLQCIFVVVIAGGCDCLGRKQIRYMFVGQPFRSARKEDVRVNLWNNVLIM